MGDSWEDEDDLPPLPVASRPAAVSQFADEDAEEEEKEVPKIASSKKVVKKEAPKSVRTIDVPLDDPIAEKDRQRRLIEESDFANAQDLFGGAAPKSLEELDPRTMKDFEEYSRILVAKYVAIHAENKNFKIYLKTLFKECMDSFAPADIKDIETSMAGFRAEKMKAETAAATAAKNKGKKVTVNMGRSGGAAGLDDYYDHDNDHGSGDDDGYDFM
jgi:translation initiation factor 3 subunit J